MRSGKRGVATLSGVAALSLVLTACGSSSTSPSASSNSGGKPVAGGILNMLGTGDVDYMDPNISYYSIGYLGLRMWSRQLFTYPAVQGQTTNVVPDLATEMPTTANGGISDNGTLYKITIKTGAMWNTTPARQVTAADAVRGLKRTCNPAQPFGGLPDFETLIQGFQSFCTGFAKVAPTASAIASYINTHNISGVSVDPSNPLTVEYKLVHPATYFVNILALPAFSPAPVEVDSYVPASAALAQHTISDGPYEISSYNPTKQIVFVRNPAWKASTDSVRHAYVNEIVVNETGNQDTIQQQLETNTPSADMEWDAFPPPAVIPSLIAKHDPNLNLGPTYASNPYVVFNINSPNNGGALGKVAVRQALEYGINRANLIQDADGPQVSPPLTHILPDGIDGSKNFDLYPHNVSKAKALLAQAGYPNGLTLKMLYRPSSDLSTKMFATLQQDLSQIGVKLTGVGVPSADFYTKYLEVPSVASRGTWDISLAGWAPDWYGNAALSFFAPLFDGSAAFPPNGSNFGFLNDPKVNSLITQAAAATSLSQTNALWAEADLQVMKDAAIFPITQPNQPNYHASQVHNAIYIPAIQNFDPTNVWLTPSLNGG